MNFAAALTYLDRHINREAVAGAYQGLSVHVMEELLDAMGDPHRDYPVVHVTGTKGKGTTVALAAQLFAAAGLSAGAYTSPHVSSITERLARNGTAISEDDFAAVITTVARFVPLISGTPSYFELLTAAAFRWFADEAVDVGVIEVGLLGRFDATNVADGSIAVVTSIGKDHTDGAEGWRFHVAGEKAGIVKPGATVVMGAIDDDLVPVFEAEGPDRIIRLGHDIEVAGNTMAVGGRVLDITTPWGRHEGIYLPMHGEHQAENAAMAIAVVEAFGDRALGDDVINEGFAEVQLPGRAEVVRREPVVVLDGAHNPESMRALARTLRDEFVAAADRRLVVGMLGGRDPEELLVALEAPLAELVIVCRPESPRAEDVAGVAAAARRLGCRVEEVRSVADAVDRALALSTDEDLVAVTGSFYTVGEARDHLLG
ncbi:MAG: Mur ligase family protein [Acidimicrobiia bacterium]|nr:Mur ligase family protein [Acidimicrobiia bacterium]